MSVALVPRPAARRPRRPNPLLPVFTLGAAVMITFVSASALMTLVPAQPAVRETSPVFGPAVRLAAVQVVASK